VRGKNSSCSAHLLKESLEIPMKQYQLGSVSCSSPPVAPFVIPRSDVMIDSNPRDTAPSSECTELIDLMTLTQLALK
jgi:hypothetical protein